MVTQFVHISQQFCLGGNKDKPEGNRLYEIFAQRGRGKLRETRVTHPRAKSRTSKGLQKLSAPNIKVRT